MEPTTTPAAAVVSKAAMHDAMQDVTARDMIQMLGVVYSTAPAAFTAALTTIRPDLPQAPAPVAPACGCRPTDRTTRGHVRVQGHAADCDDAAPRVYTFLDDGQLRTGTLAAWASAWEYATEYSDTPPSAEVRTWDAVYEVTVEQCGRPDEDGEIQYRIAAGNEAAHAQITRR
ncbi:hypothetical protein [Spirillospora sp. NBC_01491]|uniref:hypothetical protein n=1 Tax=Spirillospora sp. NBC_01491 TaxID=2976007 RepID=UPI002E312293|nr:hypothetical protein [Spirillospora sp. NBC_01491]